MKKLREYLNKPAAKILVFVLNLIIFCIALHYFVYSTTILNLVFVLLTGYEAIMSTKKVAKLEKDYLKEKNAKKYLD